MAFLEIKDLSFCYPGKDKNAVDSVSFALQRGDFLCVCGATGSGKSTLLKLLKRELKPMGELSGEVCLDGVSVNQLNPLDSARRVGFVAQRPDEQLVCDKVWHELAFGLESLGLDQNEIRRRVSEMACYFGIEDWFDKNVNELSGGQKQLLNLASVMAMQPDLLLLDEPTAQLDPIAAADFIGTLVKLNRELGLTLIVVEHRLEDVLNAADKLLVLENGKVIAFDGTQKALMALSDRPDMREYLPAAARLHFMLQSKLPCPISVKQGRQFIQQNYDDRIKRLPEDVHATHAVETAVEFSGVCFRYARELPDVLKDLSFSIHTNEIFFILGGNGSGKSTLLSCAAGLHRPYAGSVSIFGKKLKAYRGQELYNGVLALLPQDVQTVFLRPTLREELQGLKLDELPFDLTDLLNSHPYDLSGGQQQLAALAIALKTRPRLLMLDEPTKGLDPASRALFVQTILRLRDKGMTIVCVTHDMEFAASAADRCALLFRGEFTSCDAPKRFFPNNSFYTTAASRMAKGSYEGIATLEQLAEILRLNGNRTEP